MTGGAIITGDPLNRSHPLARGLVSFWLPLPNIQGSRLFDYAGGNHGTLTNGPTWTTGENGFGAVSLDGSDDHIVGTNTFGVSGTVAVAVYPDFDGSDGNFRYLLDTSGSRTLLARASSSQNCIWYVNGTEVADGTPLAGLLNYRTWTHLLFTWTGSVQRFYKNGRLFDSRSASVGSSSGSTLYLGQRFSGSERWLGRVGHYAEWPRVLSDSDAAGWYDQTRRGFPDVLRRTRRRRAAFSGTSPPPPPPSVFLPAFGGPGLGW